MEKETSDFDAWLRECEEAIRSADLATALDALSLHVKSDFDTRLWFVEVMGRRWSFIAGDVRETPSRGEVERIELPGRFGLCVGDWGRMPEIEREKFVAWIGRLVAGRFPRVWDRAGHEMVGQVSSGPDSRGMEGR